MSRQLGQPPLDVVKVEVDVEEEDDGTGGLEPDTMASGNEVDSDVKMLETVADLLSNGPWLSCGSDRGENLGRRLLDLGERLEGWKRWEKKGRLKGEELRDVKDRFKKSELRLEMIMGSKAELRKTYDLEVERRIKAELEVAELKKEAGEEVVRPVVNEVGVQTKASTAPFPSMTVLQGSDPQARVANTAGGMEVVIASSSEESTPENAEPALQDQDKCISFNEISDDYDNGSLAETGESVAVASDPSSSLPGTSHNLRRRSCRVVGKNAQKEHPELASDSDGENHDDEDKGDAPVIDSSARKRSKRKRRIADRSSSVRQRYQCDRCKAVLSSQYNLDRHVGTVHANEARGDFSCYVCSKQFLHKSNFMEHLKTHPANQSYRCKTCGAILKCREKLQIHMKIHDSNRERKFACHICSSKFFTSNNLCKHMATHRSEKPFKCPKCPKRFKLAYIVKQHLAIHSNLKHFKCELCEMSFNCSSDHVRHFRVHTRERPYPCQVCKKGFTQPAHLSTHMKTHQGEEGKTHQCPFCQMKFVQKSDCRWHQQSRHKSELASSAQPDSKAKKETKKEPSTE